LYNVFKYDLLKRYIIAYNGYIVENEAKYVITDGKEDERIKEYKNRNVNVIHSKWIWDSINEGELKSLEEYLY